MQSTNHLCPLCGKENHCILAATAPATQQNKETPCWCHNIDIPEALCEKIPAVQQMKTCICNRCVNRFKIKQSSP